MKKGKIKLSILILIISSFLMSSCSGQKKEVNFSSIDKVMKLTTLECYYHNVAKSQVNENGVPVIKDIFKTGYKKIWIEYDGVVSLGIDANKVEVSNPDANNIVKISIPKASVLKVDVDKKSFKKPIEETGIFTSITQEEKDDIITEAQIQMQKAVENNEELLQQAQKHAEEVLEGFILNTGKLMGEEYTIEWIENK